MAKSIDMFLQGVRNKNTLSRYKTAIERFFKYLKIDDPDEYLKSTDIKTFESDIWNYIDYLDDEKKVAPKTIKLQLSVIKNFFIMNDIEIKQSTWIRFSKRTPKAYAQVQDAVPTKEILREILQYCDFKTKTIAMMLLSSGMRVGEVIGLKISDIEEYKGFIKINIPRHLAKGGYTRVTFISSEAKELLTQWLKKERKNYLENARRKTNFEGSKKVSLRDQRIFPLYDSTVRISWLGALNRSGHNERCPVTRIYRYHIHTLRKFFETNLTGHINKNAFDLMIGHIAQIDRTYTDLTYETKIKQLYDEYKKIEPLISIYTSGVSAGELASLELQLKEKSKQLEDTNKRLNHFIDLRRRHEDIIDRKSVV